MGNMLSQDEVDSLLQAVETGDLLVTADEDEGEKQTTTVAEYSFRRPNLITKDDLRLLSSVHDSFARDLQSWLSLFLRTFAEIKPVVTEQQRFSEFILSLPDTTHLIVMSLESPRGTAVLEISLALVQGIVDLLLGGDGEVSLDPQRLGDVELAVVEPVLAHFQDQLQETLEPIISIKTGEIKQESDPEYVQAMSPDTPVIIMTMDTRIGQATGIINLCIELSIVQAILASNEEKNRNWNFDGPAEEDGDTGISGPILDIRLLLRAVLGEARLRTGQLLTLMPGDIVMLDIKPGAPADVLVEDEPIFRALAGSSAGNAAVKIRQYSNPATVAVASRDGSA